MKVKAYLGVKKLYKGQKRPHTWFLSADSYKSMSKPEATTHKHWSEYKWYCVAMEIPLHFGSKNVTGVVTDAETPASR